MIRVILVALLLAAITGFAGAVVGYLAAGGDAEWSPLVAGVIASLLTIGFSFFVSGGDS